MAPKKVKALLITLFCTGLLFLAPTESRVLPTLFTEASGTGFLTYPFPWHEDMRLMAGWQYSNEEHHGAIDFVKGTVARTREWRSFDVLAAAPGQACWQTARGNDPGPMVKITHDVQGTRYETRYIHLSAVEAGIPRCPETVTVGRGQRIAAAGDSSWTRCAPPCVHLHFEVLRGWQPIDPYDLYTTPNRYPQPNEKYAGRMGAKHVWSEDPPVHFDEDKIPPTLRFSLPQLNTWYTTDQTVSWRISDEGGYGVKGFSAAWDSDPGGLPPQHLEDSGSLQLSAAGVGVHMICVRAWDMRDNEVYLTQGWFGYDPFPPTYPLQASESQGVSSDVEQAEVNDPSFEWDRAVDMVSGIAGYEVYWGTNPEGTASNWTHSESYNPGPVSPGTYYLRARAVDVAGNRSPWHTLFIFRYAPGSAEPTE